jgi:predicted phage tail protein
MSWRANPAGGTPTQYLIYVGTTSWGQNIVKAMPLGNVQTISTTLPPGTYYARVRAQNAQGISSSSDQTVFRIGTRLASPTNLTASWSGTTTTLRWGASAADSAETTPTDYVLEAGTSPGRADVASLSLGTATTFSADVPAGVYFVRVRARNANGDSNPTQDLVVAPPGTAPAPRDLVAGGAGATVDLSWAPPAGGDGLAGYVLEAGSEPGLADIVTVPIGSATRFTTEAPPGTYYVRVRAVNGRGLGVPSNEVVVRK